MTDFDTPILVVDDAKFSSAMIARTLSDAGFVDIRIAHSAQLALNLIEERPVNILLADWMMPEMDGLELTGRVRQQDEAENHFTYIILLSAKEGVAELQHAFDQGIDDFVHKSSMQTQLLPRIFAANRLSGMHNSLLQTNQLLLKSNSDLKTHNLVDALTGLGNRRYASRSLLNAIRQAESRGGAASYMLIGLHDFSTIQSRHGSNVAQEVIVGIARRLRQLVRPLDTVIRVNNCEFAAVLYQEDIQLCAPASFRRIHEGLNLKAVKTSGGFITLQAGISIGTTDAKNDVPDPEQLMQLAEQHLQQAMLTNRVTVQRWSPTANNLQA